MDAANYGYISIPLAESDLDEVDCASCGERLTDEAHLDDDDWFCEECVRQFIEDEIPEAQRYAKDNCRLTRPLPDYDPKHEYRCTPEEYDLGMKESYTPNAYLCSCRHGCTNYDDLIKDLDRGSLADQIQYDAIRERIHELLEEAGIREKLDGPAA